MKCSPVALLWLEVCGITAVFLAFAVAIVLIVADATSASAERHYRVGVQAATLGASAKSLALARELRFMREGLPAGAFSAALMELDDALRARRNCVLHLSTNAENAPALAIIYDAATDVVRVEAWEGNK